MNPYDDIMGLPHHVSKKRPQMTMNDRAAQFSPFAALVGYDDAVEETARRTQEKIELDESELAILDAKLQALRDAIGRQPRVRVTYFQRDEKKPGGAYLSASGRLSKIDEQGRLLILSDGTRIHAGDVADIESDIFGDRERG